MHDGVGRNGNGVRNMILDAISCPNISFDNFLLVGMTFDFGNVGIGGVALSQDPMADVP